MAAKCDKIITAARTLVELLTPEERAAAGLPLLTLVRAVVEERRKKRDEEWQKEWDEKDRARAEANRRNEAGEIGIELAKHIMLIPGTGERDLEIDVIKMPTPTQWASVCWAAKSVIKKLEGK